MPASRLNAAVDRPSANLVFVTKALALAGDRVMPKTTANSAWCLARAVRSALEAGAVPLAQDLMGELLDLLRGSEDRYSKTVIDHTLNLADRISAQARIEVGVAAPALMAASA